MYNTGFRPKVSKDFFSFVNSAPSETSRTELVNICVNKSTKYYTKIKIKTQLLTLEFTVQDP